MLHMVDVCGIGMLENIEDGLIVDESEWFGRTLSGNYRFSEFKIINNLTFMLKELYIIGEEEDLLFRVKRDVDNVYEIEVLLSRMGEIEYHLNEVASHILDWDTRIKRVDTLLDGDRFVLKVIEMDY